MPSMNSSEATISSPMPKVDTVGWAFDPYDGVGLDEVRRSVAEVAAQIGNGLERRGLGNASARIGIVLDVKDAGALIVEQMG